MRCLAANAIVLTVLCGCARGPYWSQPPGTAVPPAMMQAVCLDNPILLPVADRNCAWETVVDVMDDYFRIQREEPVRLIGETLTEGRLDTYPKVGATIFEPWLGDSAGAAERIESTLQSIRRQAVVRVIPAEGGYWVDVSVFKELEDVIQPRHAAAGTATLRNEDTLTRVINPVGEQQINVGWIPQGRDTALEQRILAKLQRRSHGFR